MGEHGIQHPEQVPQRDTPSCCRDVGGDGVGRRFGEGGGGRGATTSTVRFRSADDNGGTPGKSVFGGGEVRSEGEFDATGRRRRAPASSGAELLGLVAGDRVVHGKWGEGTVLGASGSGEDAEAVVHFGTVGDKKLLLRMAPLKRA